MADIGREVDLVSKPINPDGLKRKPIARTRHSERGDAHLQGLCDLLRRHRHAVASSEL